MNKWIILLIECIVLCLLFWLMCFLGTGGDEKNLASLKSYPNNLQELIKNDDRFKDKIKKPSNIILTLISNVIMFTAIDFICGIFLRSSDYLMNFVYLLILGQVLNLFDFLIIDICWWRNTKRIRFTGYDDKRLYKDAKNHFYSMLRAIPVFIIAAAISAGFLILF